MRKYNSYLVKVTTNGMELEVKTLKDKSNYSEMMSLYHETKTSIKEGTIQFMGINQSGETEIFSTQKEDKKEIDVLVDSVLDGLMKIKKYSENSSIFEGLINSTRDVNLKQVELFSNLEFNEDEAILEKAKIFDEIQDVLRLRRTLKYQNIISNNICSQLDVDKIIKTINSVRANALKKPSIDLENSKPLIKEVCEIDSIFNVENFPILNDFVDKYDKVFISENKIQGAVKPTKQECVKKNDLVKEIEEENNQSELEMMGLEGVIYIGNSFEKIKGDKVIVDKFAFKNLTAKSDESIIKQYKQEFNVITKDGENICCYKYVEGYAGYGIVKKERNFTAKTRLKLSKKYSRVEVVNNYLYCLKKAVTM